MIKIKVSYENEKELDRVLKLFKECEYTLKKAKNVEGGYKKAYITLIANKC